VDAVHPDTHGIAVTDIDNRSDQVLGQDRWGNENTQGHHQKAYCFGGAHLDRSDVRNFTFKLRKATTVGLTNHASRLTNRDRKMIAGWSRT
jgi:hypothetical protein